MVETETIYFNDDVLMEILAFLPPESVLRFKSVSRRWRDLLSTSAFLRRYSAAHRHDDRLVAFFQRAAVHETSDMMTAKHCNILPICNDENYVNVPRHVGHFVNSSNGLILCSRSRGTNVTYHVGNPLTGKFMELPLPWHGKRCLVLEDQRLDKYNHDTSECSRRKPPLLSVGLICEKNNKDALPVYTVLRAGMFDEDRTLRIDSYSSKSGKWTRGIRKLVATGNFELPAEPPVVANGVVHWYTESGDIDVYDPKGGSNHVQLIKVPYCRKDKNKYYAVTRSSHNDMLWLAVLRRHKLLFYKLPKDGGYERRVDIADTEWILMHETNIFTISEMKNKGLVACKKTTLECLVPASKSEVVAVLRQEDNISLYNVQRKSLVTVDYCGRYNENCGGYNKLFPYVRTSVLSSYRL